jgi:hypothetical protein
MGLSRPAFLALCGYSTEKLTLAAVVDIAADCQHAARPATETHPIRLIADKLRKNVEKHDANEFGEQFNCVFHVEHGPMVALSALNVKAGKRGCGATCVEGASFSRLVFVRPSAKVSWP